MPLTDAWQSSSSRYCFWLSAGTCYFVLFFAKCICLPSIFFSCLLSALCPTLGKIGYFAECFIGYTRQMCCFLPWVAFTCPCMFIPIHETTRIVLVPVSSAARARYMAVDAWLGGMPVPSGGPTSGDIYGKGTTRKPGICSLWSGFPGWTRLTLPDWLTLITLFKPRVVIMWRTQSETNLND